MEAIKDYTVHIDSKKRITLRGALYQYYNVKEYENGCIMLEPRELTVPDGISANTLKDMDRAIDNFKMGDVSPAIDLSDFSGKLPGWDMRLEWEFLKWRNYGILFRKWGLRGCPQLSDEGQIAVGCIVSIEEKCGNLQKR